MLDFVFENPTRILFGKGRIEEVGREASNFGRRVLMVMGGGSVKRSGLYDRVLLGLKAKGLEVFELSGVEPNPRLTTINAGIELCRKHGIDLLLPVGGGSTIDAAKAMAAGALYEGDVWDFAIGKAKVSQALPIGVVLTLAATGSEANGNSVISHWELHEKRAIKSPLLFPRFSVLDPEVTFSVPADQTAFGAVDIMAHVFEQYFNPPGAEGLLQERMCEAVLATIVRVAPVCLAQPHNYEARAEFMWSGTIALNSLLAMGARTDWASHGIEHSLSAIYDIPHGAGLAVIFPAWMRYVADTIPGKFAGYAHRIWNVPDSGDARKDAREGIERTERFFASLGIPTRLSGWNIDGLGIPEMAQKAVAFGPIGSVRPLGREDVEAILRSAL